MYALRSANLLCVRASECFDEGLTHVRLEVFIEYGEHELPAVREDVVLVGGARNVTSGGTCRGRVPWPGLTETTKPVIPSLASLRVL
jgi:hypothetical protein